MAKKIGAVVALVVLTIMIMGSLVFSTPMGQKALGLMGNMPALSSPQDLTSCVSGGCGAQPIGMSLFS